GFAVLFTPSPYSFLHYDTTFFFRPSLHSRPWRFTTLDPCLSLYSSFYYLTRINIRLWIVPPTPSNRNPNLRIFSISHF
ncbi:unnamed protein product, partial [Amoebophrya sp. A25]